MQNDNNDKNQNMFKDDLICNALSKMTRDFEYYFRSSFHKSNEMRVNLLELCLNTIRDISRKTTFSHRGYSVGI